MTLEPYLEARHAKMLEHARAFAQGKLEALEADAEQDVNAAGKRAVRLMGDEGLLKVVVPKSPAVEPAGSN